MNRYFQDMNNNTRLSRLQMAMQLVNLYYHIGFPLFSKGEVDPFSEGFRCAVSKQEIIKFASLVKKAKNIQDI